MFSPARHIIIELYNIFLISVSYASNSKQLEINYKYAENVTFIQLKETLLSKTILNMSIDEL